MDRRKHQRFDCELSLKSASTGDVEKTKIVNISLGGLGVITSSLLPRGLQINLNINLPEFKKHLDINARVVHVQGKEVGFEFIDLPPESQRLLLRYLNVFHGLKAWEANNK